MSFLHPLGPDLLRHNLLLIAERLRWPDGAAQACVDIADEFPGWSAHWYQGGLKPHGFYAHRRNHRPGERGQYGATVEELRVKIREFIAREVEAQAFEDWQGKLYRERGQ